MKLSNTRMKLNKNLMADGHIFIPKFNMERKKKSKLPFYKFVYTSLSFSSSIRERKGTFLIIQLIIDRKLKNPHSKTSKREG